MAELKPRSMRLSDENYTKLQGLAEGRSLDETIHHLLTVCERDEERTGLGNQAARLDEMDELLAAVRSQYAAVLHICQNAKETVRAEYRRELEEKQTLLDRLKDEMLKLQKNSLRKDASAQEMLEKLRVELEESKKQNKQLARQLEEGARDQQQKQELNQSLTVALKLAEKKAAQMEIFQRKAEEVSSVLDTLKPQLQALQEQQKQLTAEKNRLQRELEEITSQLELERNDRKKKREEEEENLRQKYEQKLCDLQKEHEASLKRQKESLEEKFAAARTRSDLRLKEEQLQAQARINDIKEEYQNRLFELLMREKKQDTGENNHGE